MFNRKKKAQTSRRADIASERDIDALPDGMYPYLSSGQLDLHGTRKIWVCNGARVRVYDQVEVTAFDSAKVLAYDNASVTAAGASQRASAVEAHDHAFVWAIEAGYVKAYDQTVIRAQHSAIVDAYDAATVRVVSSHVNLRVHSPDVVVYFGDSHVPVPLDRYPIR